MEIKPKDVWSESNSANTIRWTIKNANDVTPMFALTNLEKIKDTRLKLSQGSVTVL